MSYPSTKRILAAACALSLALALIVQGPHAAGRAGNAPASTVASGSTWSGAAPHEATPDGTINAI
jgi:hypothetical protein